MKALISSLAAIVVTPVLVCQDPTLAVTNFRGVVSTATHPTTGARYPYSPTVPPGYEGSGVAPGTRAWTFTPDLRLKAGHQGPNYLTLTGMTQVIMIGAATTNFSSVYQFGTGIAPAASVVFPEKFRHAPTGNDIVSFPPAPITVSNITNYRHSFTLSTPVALPEVPLVLFVEYQGGEQRDHASLGQTMACDWRGGPPFRNGVYYGFTVGQNPRTVSICFDNLWRGQIGMIVQEPQFTATGYHANNYDPNPPLTNEDYRGLAAAFPDDWVQFTSQLASLFFHFDGGGQAANGTATVLFNFTKTQFPARLPTPFGFLMLSPADPLLTTFADAGVTLPLDPQGQYIGGPATPFSVPNLGTAAMNTYFEFQGVALTSTNQILLFNKSSMLIH